MTLWQPCRHSILGDEGALLGTVTASHASTLLVLIPLLGKLPLREPVRLSSNGTCSVKLSPIPPPAQAY